MEIKIILIFYGHSGLFRKALTRIYKVKNVSKNEQTHFKFYRVSQAKMISVKICGKKDQHSYFIVKTPYLN